MLCYKAFQPGFKCRGYQYHMGKNVTGEANCHKNGFHCASDPADCLSYYPDIHSSVYCLVEAGGDIDEDGVDSKVSCTELSILRVLTLEDYFLHILIHMARNPDSKSSRAVQDRGTARNGYIIISGKNPFARGSLGDILAMLKTGADGKAEQLGVLRVDGETILPDIYYNIDGEAESNDK